MTRTRQPDAHFEAEFAQRCQLHCAVDANQAIAESDIIITATPGHGPLFDNPFIQAGTHLNCVGTDTHGKRELPAGLLERAQVVVVDDRRQAQQLGELQWVPEMPCIELGELLSGSRALQRHHNDITIFDMTGLALQDLTVARFIHQQALHQGLGISVRWPW